MSSVGSGKKKDGGQPAGNEGPKAVGGADDTAGKPARYTAAPSTLDSRLSTLDSHVSRRRWMQLMGASLALAAAQGCRWEKKEILPFAKRPAGHTPGKPQRFATAMELGGSPLGLRVTCVDGRPIKVEGSPKHPASLGATNAFAQAAILELYDPDRSRNPALRQAGAGDADYLRTWDEFAQWAGQHFADLRKTGGQGLRILAEASSSPTLTALRKRLLESFPEAKWHVYEPLAEDRPGAGHVQLALDKADVIVCLDADLLGAGPAAVRAAHEFAARRDGLGRPMNRLYAVEPCQTVTGAVADHRLALRRSQMGAFAAALLKEISQNPPAAPRHEAGPDDDPFRRFVRAVAADLLAHRGRSVVVAGPRAAPSSLEGLVDQINQHLGNGGATVFYPGKAESAAGLGELTDAMRQGKVKTLLMLGGNPVYNAPADLEFAEALGKVETSIHLSHYRDETSRRSTWHLPRAHFLESWGDVLSADGTYSVVQPMIEPLFGGRSVIELLAILLDGGTPNAEELVRAQFRQLAGEQDSGKRWRKTLHDGVLEAATVVKPRPVVAGLLEETPPEVGLAAIGAFSDAQHPHPLPLSHKRERGDASDPPPATGADGARSVPATVWDGKELEIVFLPDAKVYDGRFANNGWLQEWPDPLTRLTWDNAAMLSPATAEKLGVENETLVKLTFKGRELTLPAYVMPGMADGSVAVTLGYGRTAAGHVGGLVEEEGERVEPIGANTYRLRTSDAMDFGIGLKVEPTGTSYALAAVRDHFRADAVGAAAAAERAPLLVREATLAHFKEHPDFAQHAVHSPPLESLWEEPPYQKAAHRWAMAIDLSKCIGCGACVMACQAENNIPVVGKERVLRNREMHWLRVDRYFTGARVAFQPLACQHCEMAPCEQVCPVAATVHGAEGLNEMVYNRCLGVRYCSNNCPYKARRFNFFNYRKHLEDPKNETLKMANNPEVTVRSRGVMEKCSFCVQRLQAVKIEAKNSRRPIADGEIQTACQQACPARAIVFGNLADKSSAVAQWHQSPRAYAILAELNTKPRNKYLARVWNPNPELRT